MKKKLYSIIAACVMVISAFVLVACGETSKPVDYSYTQLSTLTETMKKDTSLFEAGSIDGVTSSYLIKALNNDTHGYYNEVLVIPMTYIHRNLGDLETIKLIKNMTGEQKTAVDNLNKSVEKMTACYQTLKAQSVNLNSFPTGGTLYEGALQGFQYECTKFISNVYDVAFDMADIEIAIFNRFEDMKTRALVEEDSVRMRNYVSLDVGYDYFNLLLESANSKRFTATQDASTNVHEFTSFVDKAKLGLKEYLVSVYSIWPNGLKSMQSEPNTEGATPVYNNVAVGQILEMRENMNEERKILSQSFSKFSLYDFYQSHNCNIKSYANAVKYAEIYYNQIQDYYNNYAKLQNNYFKSMLVK